MADKFRITGRVRGVSTHSDDAGDKSWANVKIEADGVTQEWRTWTVKQGQDLEVGNWYDFEVSTPAKERGGGTWHNLEKVIGPAQAPAQGVATGSDGSTSGQTVKTDAQLAREQLRADRQLAVDVVIRLVETGIPVDQLETTLKAVLLQASTVETHYRRPVDSPAHAAAPEAQPVKRTKTQSSKSPSTTNGASAEPAEPSEAEFPNIGALLNRLFTAFPDKKSKDLCDLLGIENPVDIKDRVAAYKTAIEAWSTRPK